LEVAVIGGGGTEGLARWALLEEARTAGGGTEGEARGCGIARRREGIAPERQTDDKTNVAQKKKSVHALFFLAAGELKISLPSLDYLSCRHTLPRAAGDLHTHSGPWAHVLGRRSLVPRRGPGSGSTSWSS